MDFQKWWMDKMKEEFNPEEANTDVLKEKEKITIENIRSRFSDVEDFVIKEIDSEQLGNISIIFLKTLVNKTVLQKMVINPIQYTKPSIQQLRFLFKEVNETDLPRVITCLLRGQTVLLVSKSNAIFVAHTYSVVHRSITASETESTVLGPQDAFIESLDTNLSLIKRRITNPNLKNKTLTIGTESKTLISVLYIDGIANEENLKRILHRINSIEYMGFVGLPQLKQMIEDKPYSPFPQLGLTFRPDSTVSALLNGRIIILMNGSPDAVICPASFLEMFNSPDDYYNRWWTATLLRSLRLIGFFLSIFLTSSYVSALTYHPEILPPPLLSLLIESRAKVPFPPMLEALTFELIIEVLREAGARMPTKIGQTIGIVGGIVIGTASVEAGLASNVIVVIVSVSALLSFMPTNYLMSNAIRIIRYLSIIAAGFLGMYGQMLVLAFLLAHMANLTSIGTPYMTPVIPRRWSDLFDSTVRAPYKFMLTRKAIARAKKYLTQPLDEE